MNEAIQHVAAAEVAPEAVRKPTISVTRGERLFYRVFLPLGVLANLALGLLLLMGLQPATWAAWLQIAIGAFCCVVAGWLAAVAWSKSYWNRAMRRQVAVWGHIADAFFAWLEDAPLPAEALGRLKSSLDEAVQRPETH
jgi:hypothetical protein